MWVVGCLLSHGEADGLAQRLDAAEAGSNCKRGCYTVPGLRRCPDMLKRALAEAPLPVPGAPISLSTACRRHRPTKPHLNSARWFCWSTLAEPRLACRAERNESPPGLTLSTKNSAPRFRRINRRTHVTVFAGGDPVRDPAAGLADCGCAGRLQQWRQNTRGMRRRVLRASFLSAIARLGLCARRAHRNLPPGTTVKRAARCLYEPSDSPTRDVPLPMFEPRSYGLAHSVH